MLDRGAWRATVHGVAKSRTWLKWLSVHACMAYPESVDVSFLSLKIIVAIYLTKVCYVPPMCRCTRARVGKLRPNTPVFVWSVSQEWFSHLKKMVGKKKRKIIVCDTWKLYEIQMSMSINKVLSEHNDTLSFTVVSGLQKFAKPCSIARALSWGSCVWGI